MSTNYYIRLKGREKPLHIGKSSIGWAFSLHYIPGILENLDQWKDYINNKDNIVYNEYQQKVSVEELLDTITKRGYKGDTDNTYKPAASFMTKNEINEFEIDNHAVYDSNIGLWRQRAYFVVSNPPNETYDIIEGDFS